jgi:hypothetical protein
VTRIRGNATSQGSHGQIATDDMCTIGVAVCGIRRWRRSIQAKSRDLADRIEMLRPPAEVVLRLRATEPLIQRISPRPFAELGCNRVCRNNFRFLISRSEAPGEGSCDFADRDPFHLPRRYSSIPLARAPARAHRDRRGLRREQAASAPLRPPRPGPFCVQRHLARSDGRRRRLSHRPSPDGSRCRRSRLPQARAAG